MRGEYRRDRDSGLLLPRGMRGHPEMGAPQQALLMVRGAAAGGVWDTSLMDFNCYTLSDADRTATYTTTSGAAYNAVLSKTSRTTGKYYFEILATTITKFGTNYPPAIGVGFSTGVGFGCRVNGNHLDNRAYYLKGAAGDSGTPIAEVFDGDTVMIAVDLGAAKAWYGKNGTWALSGDPGAGTNPSRSDISGAGLCYAGLGAPNPYSFVVTSRFLASQQSYGLPSGFSEWG